MGPDRVRRILSQYGEIDRIYLVAEGKCFYKSSRFSENSCLSCVKFHLRGITFMSIADETLRRKRMKAGGNRGIKYIEGWVEFKDKAEAKSTASALHGTRVGR